MLDIKKLQAQLEIDEGVKYEVYLDSLGLPTFGVGHLVRKSDPEWALWQNRNGKKVPVTKQRVAQVFEEDCQSVLRDCSAYIKGFEKLPEEIKQILANMMFNMGLTKMSKLFVQFRKDLIAADYKMAAKEMQYNNGRKPTTESAWYLQTKGRAQRLVARMDAFANDKMCQVPISPTNPKDLA